MVRCTRLMTDSMDKKSNWNLKCSKCKKTFNTIKLFNWDWEYNSYGLEIIYCPTCNKLRKIAKY